MQELIKQLSKIDHEPKPFDLSHWLIEQRYIQAVANTDQVIKEMRK